jgi:hypothetical protein
LSLRRLIARKLGDKANIQIHIAPTMTPNVALSQCGIGMT